MMKLDFTFGTPSWASLVQDLLEEMLCPDVHARHHMNLIGFTPSSHKNADSIIKLCLAYISG